MAQSRIKNSLRNASISLCSYLVVVLLQFINRTIFIKYLSVDYLGLNGLFSNVLSFLSLAELGIGNAMAFALYKPLKENDLETVKSLMKLYKKMYTFVGGFIAVSGLALTPFLPYLIKDLPNNISNIYIFYILYVANSALSYFFSYKRTLIICDQKQYISSLSTTCKTLLLSVLQISILIYTSNYMYYLICNIIATLAENIVISNIADKNYPYLKEKNSLPLGKELYNSIQKNIYAMIFHKIGSMVVFSTDNLIISKFVGLTQVGIYSNYVMITNALTNLISQMFNAISASVGNLLTNADKVKNKRIFDNIFFLNFWIFAFSSTSLFVLLPNFIKLWIGPKLIFDHATSLIICLNFYVTGMRRCVGIFKDSAGLFWEDRFKPIFESVANIVFSIPLTIKFGVMGTLLGTILTTILISIPIESKILFNKYFNLSTIPYAKKQISYLFITIIVCSVTYICVNLIVFDTFIGFFLKICVCAVVPNVIIIVLFYRTEEFKYFLQILLNLASKFSNKMIEK